MYNEIYINTEEIDYFGKFRFIKRSQTVKKSLFDFEFRNFYTFWLYIGKAPVYSRGLWEKVFII